MMLNEPPPPFESAIGISSSTGPKLRAWGLTTSAGSSTGGLPFSRSWAAATAAAASIKPWPKKSSRPAAPRSWVMAPDANSRSKASGVSVVGATVFISAATPATWGVAMEVPW